VPSLTSGRATVRRRRQPCDSMAQIVACARMKTARLICALLAIPPLAACSSSSATDPGAGASPDARAPGQDAASAVDGALTPDSSSMRDGTLEHDANASDALTDSTSPFQDSGPTFRDSAPTPDDGASDGGADDGQSSSDAGAACDEAELAWDYPGINPDGSCVTALAGFRIYWSESSGGPYPNVSDVGKPCVVTQTVTCLGQQVDNLTCTFRLSAFTNGTWYFVATAYDTSQIESAYSNEASKQISCP